jgi:hypothetical protein
MGHSATATAEPARPVKLTDRGKVKVTVELPPDLHRAMYLHRVDHGTPLSTIAARGIEQYLAAFRAQDTPAPAAPAGKGKRTRK